MKKVLNISKNCLHFPFFSLLHILKGIGCGFHLFFHIMQKGLNMSKHCLQFFFFSAPSYPKVYRIWVPPILLPIFIMFFYLLSLFSFNSMFSLFFCQTPFSSPIIYYSTILVLAMCAYQLSCFFSMRGILASYYFSDVLIGFYIPFSFSKYFLRNVISAVMIFYLRFLLIIQASLA